MAAIAALVFAAWFASWLDAGVWEFWGMFFGAAVIFTALCNWLVDDHRVVRIKRHDDKTITFAFSRPEYAQEFTRLNGQAVPVPAGPSCTSLN